MSRLEAGPRRLGGRWALLLALLAVVPFLNGLPNAFTYDDGPIVKDNPLLASPAAMPKIFAKHYFGGTMATGTAYRPVVLLTYAVQKWVHGNRAWAFRLVNVLLHAAATLLFATTLLEAGLARAPALGAAALFATATIHVEAVTSVVGRAELLAAALVLFAARAWLRAGDGDAWRRGPYVASLAAFLVALFVKENAIVLPGVVVLLELFRDGRRPTVAALRDVVRRRGLALAAYAVPVALLFAARRAVLGSFLGGKGAIWDLENPLVAMAAPLRAANAAGFVIRGIAKAFVPVGLSADHSANALRLATRLGDPLALAGLAGLGAFALATILLARRLPLAAFGLAFFLGTLLPTANLLFPIGTVYAERLLYLPSAGLFLAAVAVFAPPEFAVPRPGRFRLRFGLLAVLVAANAAGTIVRNRVWRDDLTLYADMVDKVPRSAKARYDYAWELSRLGRRAEAERHLLRAVEEFPRHYDSWGLLGRLAWDDGRLSLAIARYRRAVEAHTYSENGRWGLAKTLEAAGRLPEASAAFDEGVAVLPASYPLAWHRAAFLESRGRLEEAVVEWGRAAGLTGGAAAARLRQARVEYRLGRVEESWGSARRALVESPGWVEPRLFLAETYEAKGKTLAAAGELSRAVRSDAANATAARALLGMGLRRPDVARFRAELAAPLVRRALGASAPPELRELLARYGEGG